MGAMVRDTDSKMARTLRLSVTGECNLHCFYCKSIGGSRELFHTNSPIQPSDVSKLVKIVGELGVNKVVIAGGEPLLRKDAPNFVKAAYCHKNVRDVSLVTNGTFLKTFADSLRKMGLRKIEVNFDSLNFLRYHRITGKDNLYRVLDGIEKVEKLNYSQIRLNIRLLKGVNEDEIVEFARMTKDRKLHIRFVEYHPKIISANMYGDKLGLSVLNVKRCIDNYQTLVRLHELEEEIQIPTFRFADGCGKLSFVSKVELDREALVPRALFNIEGVLSNELVPNRFAPILSDLRKDAKESRLHKLIEKILTLQTSEDKKPQKAAERTVASKSHRKVSPAVLRSRSARSSAASAVR